MKGMLRSCSCLLLVALSACASEEAYLTLQVRYADDAQGKFGVIKLQHINGSELEDGPFQLTADRPQRRIAVHAEGDEIEAELELELQLCEDDDEDGPCPEVRVLSLEHVFEAGHTTELCFEFASMAPGQWPDKIDVAAGTFPVGMSDCSAR
jgi:hypothetical protein